MKITIWDILSFFLLLLLLLFGALILMIFNDPYAAVNPFPPPTAPVKMILSTWTPTPQSMPPTWTPTSSGFTLPTLASSSTPMASATRSVLFPVIRPTRTNTSTVTNTPAVTNTATKATSGPTKSPTITPTRTNTRTAGPSPTGTQTRTSTATGTATSTATPTATQTDTPAPQPTAIAFSVDHNSDGFRDLVTMSSNGQYATMIRSGSSGAEPILTDWSPDGEWLLFHVGSIPQVKKIRPDGSDESIINNLGFNSYDAVYSPDGSWILYVQGSGNSAELHRLNSSGALPPQRLTTDSFQDSSPVWSPDGRKIVYLSLRSGRTDLYMLDLDTGPDYVIVRLTDTAAVEYAPRFVSNEQIVYTVSTGSQHDIYIANITNVPGTATNLTSTTAENERYPSWAPGPKIIYAKQDGEQGIYTMELNGTGKTRLTSNFRYAINLRWIP